MIDHEGDRRVLAALAQRGANLQKKAHIVHYLYFRNKQNAQAAAQTLSAQGYTLRPVRVAPTNSLWKRLFGPREYSCIAETHAVPSEQHVFATTDRMNALAERFEGNYDGWEASVER